MKAPWTTQIASDILRDGLGLELRDGSGAIAAEVFRCDADHSVTVRRFGERVPDDVLAEFIEHARQCLHPFEDGTSLPECFEVEGASADTGAVNPVDLQRCPCCDYLTLEERGQYAICPVCFWEDDGIDLPDLDVHSGPNHMTLRQGRQNFESFGACDRAMLPNVLPESSRSTIPRVRR